MEYVRSLGLRISEDEKIRADRWDHFYFANSLEIQMDGETFKDNNTGFWVNFAKRRLVALGLPSATAIELAPKISAYMEESHKPEVYVPQEARALLASLKEDGYTLGMVSNRDKPFREELEELKLGGYFKFSLAGGEVNSYKPDKVIFEKALEMAGTSAAETMYVGDNYFADAIGSLRANLTPVLYDPNSLFPEAGCAVIKSFSELPPLLK